MLNESSQTSADPPPETVSGLAISLAFWLCLLASAVLFSLVALSPKFLAYLQLRRQFEANQTRLVSIEQQSDQLQRVIDAIRNDKDFASELTRVEFDAVRPGEEVIPVDASLELDTRRVSNPVRMPKTSAAWYEPVIHYIASENQLRMSLLGAAGFLVVVSFTLLQPAGAEQLTSGVLRSRSVWRTLRNRYVRQA